MNLYAVKYWNQTCWQLSGPYPYPQARAQVKALGPLAGLARVKALAGKRYAVVLGGRVVVALESKGD